MRQTSLEAYHENKKLRMSAQRGLVYSCLLRHGPLCDKEIKWLTGLPINVVTPRRGELVNRGIVCFAGYEYNPKRVMKWRVSDGEG